MDNGEVEEEEKEEEEEEVREEVEEKEGNVDLQLAVGLLESLNLFVVFNSNSSPPPLEVFVQGVSLQCSGATQDIVSRGYTCY